MAPLHGLVISVQASNASLQFVVSFSKFNIVNVLFIYLKTFPKVLLRNAIVIISVVTNLMLLKIILSYSFISVPCPTGKLHSVNASLGLTLYTPTTTVISTKCTCKFTLIILFQLIFNYCTILSGSKSDSEDIQDQLIKPSTPVTSSTFKKSIQPPK